MKALQRVGIIVFLLGMTGFIVSEKDWLWALFMVIGGFMFIFD